MVRTVVGSIGLWIWFMWTNIRIGFIITVYYFTIKVTFHFVNEEFSKIYSINKRLFDQSVHILH